MQITSLTFLPPAVGVLVLIGLVVVLRHVLRLRNMASTAQPEPLSATQEPLRGGATLAAITRRWNSWITGVLPISLGIAVLVVAIWVSAYIGWICVALIPGSEVPLTHPPLFGNPGIVLVYAFIGALPMLFAALGGTLFFYAAGALGRAFLWPETCDDDGHRDPPPRDEDDDGDDDGDPITLLLGGDD